MTTKGFDDAMVCLHDARNHAVEGEYNSLADHNLADDKIRLLHKHAAPTKCRTCGQTIPAQTQRWYTQPCDAGAEKGKT